MQDGQPTFEKMCQILGTVYADAACRVEFLENENKKLREDWQELSVAVKNLSTERDRLKALLSRRDKDEQEWNSGKGNSILPESWLQRPQSESEFEPTTTSPPDDRNDSTPPRSIAGPEPKP